MSKITNQPQMSTGNPALWTPAQYQLAVSLYFLMIELQESLTDYSKSKIAAPYLEAINRVGPNRSGKLREVIAKEGTLNAYISTNSRSKLCGKLVYAAARRDWYNHILQNICYCITADEPNGLGRGELALSGLNALEHARKGRNSIAVDPMLRRYAETQLALHDAGISVQAIA